MQYKFLTVTLLFFELMLAQQSVFHYQEHKNLNKGYIAYQNEDFVLAKKYFKDQVSIDELTDQWKQEYILLSDLQLFEKGADKRTEQYLKANPNNTNYNQFLWALGDYYFKRKKVTKAKEMYEQIDAKHLSIAKEEELNFKLGFLNFSKGNFTEAKSYLTPLVNHETYKDEVNYYLGNIALQQNDFETALQYFDKVKDVKAYQKEVAYHRLVILYKSKAYQKAIDLGTDLLKNTPKKEQIQLNKIIGESHFYLENYEEAVKYLSAYKVRKPTLTDDYFLGYAYYKTENYDKAIENFNQITHADDPVAQNAYYHLGMCYVNSDQKSEALSAFKKASEMEYDVAIKQDALLNYAKLSYEVGNPFEPSATVLKRYVNTYPNSKETSGVQALVINSYLQYKDYQGAIDYYDTDGLAKDEFYQSALLQRGFQFFEKENLTTAYPYFDKASQLYNSKSLQAQANFWKAETQFLQQKYKEAAYHYNVVTQNGNAKSLEEYKLSFYGLGYTYFLQKKYDNSIEYFNQYLSLGTAIDKKDNALLRIADARFVQKKYWPAIETYNQIIEKNHIKSDYAWYQKALSYGFLGRNEEKLAALNHLQRNYKTSAYLDKSYYQLANLYLKQNKNDEALTTYDKVIQKFPKSGLVSKSMLKQGFIHFNENNNPKALQTFKKVVKEYPGTSDAVQAVKGAEQVYKEMDDISAYAVWVKQLDFINITDAEIEKTMFTTAEGKYLQGAYEKAIPSFKKYLLEFPKGLYSLTANFYLAQSHYVRQQKTQAIAPYQNVLAVNQNEYTEQSLHNLAQIYLENEDWKLAYPLLDQLLNDGYSLENQFFGLSNLMKFYFFDGNYNQTLTLVNKVLKHPNVTENIRNDAYLLGGRAAMKTDQWKEAKRYYAKLEDKGNANIQAEALYHKAYFLRDEKSFKASNEVIKTLASQYQQEKEWGVKGLILMAKNYSELNDDFQANYILKNVIENTDDFPEIKSEAQKVLQEINIEEEAASNEEETQFLTPENEL